MLVHNMPGGLDVDQALDSCEVTTLYRLNLRAGPGLDSEILDIVPFNRTFAVIEQQANWFRVQHGDTAGWLSGRYLDQEADCDS